MPVEPLTANHIAKSTNAIDNRERLIRDLGSVLFLQEKATYAALPGKLAVCLAQKSVRPHRFYPSQKRCRFVIPGRTPFACFEFSNTQLELAASGIQIFRKTAANLEAVPEYARGTPHCEPYRQKYKRKSSSPLSEAGCCSTRNSKS